MACSLLAFGVWIVLARAAWPRDGMQWLHLAVTGVLMHGGYLGGVWIAIKGGLGAGLVALIVGLQPLLTALWLSAQQGQDRGPSRHAQAVAGPVPGPAGSAAGGGQQAAPG
jgi:drug/metabolite transporter (DMT)-like permease